MSAQIHFQNGLAVITSIKSKTITINKVTYPIPEHIAKRGNSVSIVDKQVFVNGFEFDQKQKKFKRSLKALYHLYF